MKPNNTTKLMADALEHCIAYFESIRPKNCGVEDDRDCSPYHDALEALIEYQEKSGDRFQDRIKRKNLKQIGAV